MLEVLQHAHGNDEIESCIGETKGLSIGPYELELRDLARCLACRREHLERQIYPYDSISFRHKILGNSTIPTAELQRSTAATVHHLKHHASLDEVAVLLLTMARVCLRLQVKRGRNLVLSSHPLQEVTPNA